MAKPLLALTLLAAALTAAPAPAQADDDPTMVLVHFHPTPDREDELKTRLLRLRDFVNAHAPRRDVPALSLADGASRVPPARDVSLAGRPGGPDADDLPGLPA